MLNKSRGWEFTAKVETVAVKAECHKRTVQRALKLARDLNFIDVTYNKDPNSPNQKDNLPSTFRLGAALRVLCQQQITRSRSGDHGSLKDLSYMGSSTKENAPSENNSEQKPHSAEHGNAATSKPAEKPGPQERYPVSNAATSKASNDASNEAIRAERQANYEQGKCRRRQHSKRAPSQTFAPVTPARTPEEIDAWRLDAIAQAREAGQRNLAKMAAILREVGAEHLILA